MAISRSVGTRILADVLMVNLGLLSAFVIRYVMVIVSSSSTDPNVLFSSYSRQFLATSWLLTIVIVGLFQGFGVYHQVRAYRQRFKAIVIVQAIAIAHLIYGFSFYFVAIFPLPPRGVVLLSWVICTVLLTGVRIARTAFRAFEESERPKTIAAASAQPRHVLVIGGAGYIGSLVLRRLLDQGYHIRLVDVLMYGDAAIQDIYSHPHFEFIRGDFRHIETIVRALVGMDAVIHLGAIVGDPACAIDADFSTEINLIATRVLAEACKGYGISRFIFASTCSVYGASDLTLDERSALKPVSLYAQTKLDSERILLELAGATFAPTILRFATIYGLSPRPRFDLVVNLLTAKAVREGKITVFGGDQWRPFVHVDDAAYAVQLALQAPLELVKGEIFNVGSDSQNYTITQIGELIHRLIPDAQLVQQGNDIDKRNYRVSFAKIARLLHFAPRHTVEDGVREIQAALANGQIGDYYDRAFNNHSFLISEDNAALLRLESPWAERLAVSRLSA
ncbi:MAG: NAD-dependent epimerase/dehydratase family protein [Herpetosiphonaceae bacterium]|nr:NAD-dependent epimerase/dehydratase family protein [Herpetosiphonaceae bacterium]